jgi:RNA binding exosome subunit
MVIAMTVQEKRQKILRYLEIIKNREANNKIGGWVDRAEAFNAIANAMDLLGSVHIKIKSQYRGYYGRNITVITDPATVQKVFDRMVEQGYIRISKSGQHVKIIKTK